MAVGAFKVAVELDLKRRENDKKIALLFLEMRDMMSALVESGIRMPLARVFAYTHISGFNT